MRLRKEAALRPEPEPEEALLQNEAIAEDDSEERVTSSAPRSPAPDAASTRPATPVVSTLTHSRPVPAPD